MIKPQFQIWIGCLILASVLINGCDSKVPAGASATNSSSGSNPSSASNGATGTKADPTSQAPDQKASTSSPDSTSTAPTPAKPTDPSLSWVSGPDLPRSSVPKNLASLPCYKYYGLGGPSQDVAITFSNGNPKVTGTVSMHLKSVDNGIAKFVVSRSGDLGQKLGNDYIELRKDGIYDVGNSLISLKHPILDLPADPQDGAKWSSDGTSQMQGQSIRQVINFTAKANQMEKIGGKMQSAMLITGHGTETQAGKTSDLTIKLYCVPELGQLKQVFVDQAKGQKPLTMVYEAVGQTDKVEVSAAKGAK